MEKHNNPALGKRLLGLFLIISLSACSSVSMRPAGGEKDNTLPTYIDSKPFYLFGLIGEHEVDVNEVCDGAVVSQMQTVITPSDYVLSLLTFFIYTPRTAKIWCEE
jgi:hypothetical protein